MTTKHSPPRVSVSQPSITQVEIDAVTDAVRSGQLTQGARVSEFQDKFAQFVGTRYALACSSGTTALHLALLAVGVKPGDEVIVPDVSFVATANAVTYVGAKPVLCDISYDTWGLYPAAVERLITSRTRAIIAVHLYGMPCEIEELKILCRKYGVRLIEDAAEGLGGYVCPSMQLGSIGDIGVFSFYGNKVITTGEGGMLVTNDALLHNLAYKYRGQGVVEGMRYFHDVIGFNYRMTDVQAAIGCAQMSRIDEILRARDAVMNAYDSYFDHHRLYMCQSALHPGWKRAPWLYTVKMKNSLRKSRAQLALDTAGFETRPVFVPMHQLPMYMRGNAWPDYPVSSHLHSCGLSLPTHAALTGDDIERIVSIVLEHNV